MAVTVPGTPWLSVVIMTVVMSEGAVVVSWPLLFVVVTKIMLLKVVLKKNEGN